MASLAPWRTSRLATLRTSPLVREAGHNSKCMQYGTKSKLNCILFSVIICCVYLEQFCLEKKEKLKYCCEHIQIDEIQQTDQFVMGSSIVSFHNFSWELRLYSISVSVLNNG